MKRPLYMANSSYAALPWLAVIRVRTAVGSERQEVPVVAAHESTVRNLVRHCIGDVEVIEVRRSTWGKVLS